MAKYKTRHLDEDSDEVGADDLDNKGDSWIDFAKIGSPRAN